MTTMVELYGGPLDGWVVPVDTGDPDPWTRVVPVDTGDPDPWTAIISDYGEHPGGRSLYAPDTRGRWRWVRDLRPEEM
ncbi:hypothetical protein [Streptomyces sp. TE33382]